MTNKAVSLLIVGGIALAAIFFWNPTICANLNGLNTGFDFCNFKSIDQAIADDPASRILLPADQAHKHHFHHFPHHENTQVIADPHVVAIPTAPHPHHHFHHAPSPTHPHPAPHHHHLTRHHPAIHPVKKLTHGSTGAKLDVTAAAEAHYGYSFLGETLDNRMSFN